MISELFFYGKLKNIEDVSVYEEDFVLFYLTIQLIEKKEFKKEDVENILEEFYGKNNIKNNGILRFCYQHFNSKDNVFFLSIQDDELRKYQKAIEFEKEIEQLTKIDKKQLYETIEKEILNNTLTFDEKLKKCIVYYYFDNEHLIRNKLKPVYKYYCIIKDYYKIFRVIDSKLDNIPELFNSVEIIDLKITEEQKSLLINNNIFTIKRIKSIPIESVICLFCNDIQGLIKEISKFAISKEKIVHNLVIKFDSLMKPDWNLVLQKRFPITSNIKSTLEEIGNELNLTRERVRQIERRATQKMVYSFQKEHKLIYYFYKDINKENKDYITIEDLLNYVEDEKLTRYLVIIINSNMTDLRYNSDIGIIYNNKEITIEEIIKEAEEQLKDIITIKEVNSFDVVKQYLIEENYKLYQNTVYKKKGVSPSYIYLNEIKENFINGYDTGSEQDYTRLVKIIQEKYGIIELSSIRSVYGMIERSDFVQIDKGRYKAKEYSAVIPERLLDEIINFIIKNSPVVAYIYVYENFKKQLNELGINNRFYLKGCIDDKLPSEFSTNRDFINTNSEETISFYDKMREIFKSFKGSFTIDDVKEKMPGLKQYTYESYAKEEEENGLIQMGRGSYIFIDKLQIIDKTKQELKEYIDDLFEKLETNVLSAKKIYSSLSIMNKELLNKLNITARFGDFELFSIIQNIFNDDYFFSRPLIGKEENFITTSYMILKEFALRQISFNYSDIKDYIYKMNLAGISSYTKFMDELSDEYVQINIDSMIRKEELHINQEQLNKIEEFMDLVLKSNELKTAEFDGYYFLPKISRVWNKYLLVGIIKTFFKEKYEVKNTTKFYDTTDFIIRRAD